MKVFAAYATGIKSNIKSFKNIISSVKPIIWMLQEMKLQPIENDHQLHYLNLQKSKGGGVAMGAEKNIESTLIKDNNDDISIQAV